MLAVIVLSFLAVESVAHHPWSWHTASTVSNSALTLIDTHLRPPLLNLHMPARRLEDLIRQLCARAVYANEPDWTIIIHALQHAIQEHNLRMANGATAVTVGGKPEVAVERRRAA